MISPNLITIELSKRISCRLYSDTRPHCLETAPLQKGLVLAVDGEELIEEGVGFGAPVVLYRDEPYFSTSAECSILNSGEHRVLVKSFLMDAVSRKRVGKTGYVNIASICYFTGPSTRYTPRIPCLRRSSTDS